MAWLRQLSEIKPERITPPGVTYDRTVLPRVVSSRSARTADAHSMPRREMPSHTAADKGQARGRPYWAFRKYFDTVRRNGLKPGARVRFDAGSRQAVFFAVEFRGVVRVLANGCSG